MQLDQSSNNEFSFKVTIILILLVIILSVLNILDAMPLFANTSIVTDAGIIYRAGYSGLPLDILTYTYFSWWRPLGFGLPIFINWLFNPPAVSFYIMGMIIHFLVGFSIWWFAQRLFSHQMAWLSCIFYALSVSSLALVGFPLNAFQDGLFSCLLLFAWGLMFPKPGKQSDEMKQYWLSAVLFLLAALCKDSWMGALPIMLATDWVLIQKSNLKERIKRLLPFLMIVPVPILHYLLADKDTLQTVISGYLMIGFHPFNLLYGFLTPFLPFLTLTTVARWHYLLAFIVVAIIVAALFSGYNRSKILLLMFMFALVLLALFSSFYSIYWGYVRITSLSVLGSILSALMLKAVLRLAKNEYLISIIIIVLIFSLYMLMATNRTEFTEFLLRVRQ